MEDDGVPVDLYIYDLSKGMASMMSAMFLGRQVDGIWHTSIVAYGQEYFFGGGGIQSCQPGGTVLGSPQKVEKLGDTFIPFDIFHQYILGLGGTTFRGSDYNLLQHNCNNFTDTLANFLCGGGIPKHILDLPQEVLNTPLGQSLRPLIESLGNGAQNIISANGIRNTRQESPEFLQLNTQIEEARLQSLALEEKRNSLNEKIARKERKKEKKRKKHQRELDRQTNSSSEYSEFSNSGFPPLSPSKSKMAEAAAVELNGDNIDELEGLTAAARQPGDKLPSDRARDIEAEERLEDEERKKYREPPIVYKDFITTKDAFEQLATAISAADLAPEDQQSLQELHQYMVEGEGSWALGDNFLSFIACDRIEIDTNQEPGPSTSQEPTALLPTRRTSKVDPPGRLSMDMIAHTVQRILGKGKNKYVQRQCRVCGASGKRSETYFMCKFCGIPLHRSRLLGDTALPAGSREAVMRALACAALKDDVILLLHQDRRDHILMNYAYSIDRITLAEQKALALFMCNMFENLSSSEWLLYISEWTNNNQQISNIRSTTKVAVHSLLSEDQELKDLGSAIVHNLACKEVFDDVAVELTMAILQHLSSAPSEEHLFRCLKALAKFCQIAGQDVPQLIQMIGPNPATFKGSSERVDEQIDLISKKLR